MRTWIFLGLIIIGFVSSCRFMDIIENHYEGYEDAIENDFIGNGYMPTEFMKVSISEIRTKLNIDINESLIKVNYQNKVDFDSIRNYGMICDREFLEPKTFNLPKWWDYEADSCLTLCFQDKYGQSFNFGFDTINLVIYGWNE
jgi:uncharacterized protein YfkK (UPF0435 family)